MLVPKIVARVVITPAQSDISEQEYSRAGSDVHVGEYPIETTPSLDGTPDYASFDFMFTAAVVNDCTTAIAETKKNLPALRKYSFYVTCIDFGAIGEDGKFTTITNVKMRTPIIGITNSRVQVQFPANKLNKHKVILA